MTYRKFILLCFSLLFVLSVKAQKTPDKIFTLTAEDGSSPRIQCLYQNRVGYIMVGTSDGLYRFDGIDFYFYKQGNVPNTGSVSAICEISSGTFWLGYSDGHIASLANNATDSVSFEEGFPKASITKMVVDNTGIIWIATAGEGLYYYEHDRLYNINTDDGLSDNYVYDIKLAANNNIHAATDRGINIVNLSNGKKNITTFSSRNGLPDNIIRTMYDAPGNISWVGMQDAGIASFNSKFQVQALTKNWSYGQVNDIIATPTEVFVATDENGLIVYDYDDQNQPDNVSVFDAQMQKITHLLKDKENNVWAASENRLMRTPGLNIENIYTLSAEESAKIHCLLHTKDKSIWFNNVTGLTRITRKKGVWNKSNYSIPGKDGADISSLYEDNTGKIWVGTLGKGIFILDPASGNAAPYVQDSVLINSNIISITGRDTSIWISSLEGIVSIHQSVDGINFTNYNGKANVGSDYINYILPDAHNRVWFATDGKGIGLLQDGRFTAGYGNSGTTGNVIYRIAEDLFGQIWFVTFKSGIIRYNNNGTRVYGLKDGLSDLSINGLATARDNILVFHKSKIDLLNAKTGSITYFDEEQGIGNINTDLNAYTSDNDDNIYFISDSSIFKYQGSYNASMMPTVLIDDIQLFLKDTTVKNGHSFRYDENNITFHYTGLYYSQPEKILYQYKLDGYDKDWVITKDKTKNFPRLAPGTYTFHIRASLTNNFTNAREASFVFTIERPFWQTAWFVIIISALIVSAVYLYIRAREKSINRFNKLEQEKISSQLETLRSQINPHFLFNSFNTLISEIEEEPQRAITYVEKLSDFYRNIVVNREKDLITLKEELAILNDYTFIQEKRYGNAFQLMCDVSNEAATQYLITPLALQLLIENAIKHNVLSLANPLVVHIYIDEEEYLNIKNKMSPKLQKEKGGGMGLQNIQKRYALISGKNIIIDNSDTYFNVRIPLIKIQNG